MKINDLRNITQMTQRQFAEYFGIPVGTLRNWEQGIANPPEYVFQMIITSIRRDKMINVETIKFVQMLDELAVLSKNGILPFENVKEGELHEKVYYDSRIKDELGNYKVVLDACVVDDPQCYHHDIISYYDSLEYNVRVVIDKESEPYISIKLLISKDIIVIENGTWYFA